MYHSRNKGTQIINERSYLKKLHWITMRWFQGKEICIGMLLSLNMQITPLPVSSSLSITLSLASPYKKNTKHTFFIPFFIPLLYLTPGLSISLSLSLSHSLSLSNSLFSPSIQIRGMLQHLIDFSAPRHNLLTTDLEFSGSWPVPGCKGN